MRTRRKQYSSSEPPTLTVGPQQIISTPHEELLPGDGNHAVPLNLSAAMQSILATPGDLLTLADNHTHLNKKPRLASGLAQAATSTHQPGISRLNLSMPSLNPDLQMMGIPTELREHILRYILVKDTEVIVSAKPSAHLRYPAIDYAAPGLTVGRKHTTAILRVCKQIHLEAAKVLYGGNNFVAADLEAFGANFIGDPTRGIGQNNARMIKNASLEVPKSVKEAWGIDSVHKFVEILSALSGLQELHLTATQSMKWTYSVKGLRGTSPDPYATRMLVKQRRGLLFATAWATRNHPTLKKAIWNSGGGGYIEPREPRGRYDNDYVVRYAVVMVRLRKDVLLDDGVTALDDRGKPKITKTAILDCQLIRNTPWAKLLDRTELDFALPGDALSSEPEE